MVETICVSSSSWHCSTRYTCFTGPWGTQTHSTTSIICTQTTSYFWFDLCWVCVPETFGSRCPVSSPSPAAPERRCCRTRLPPEPLTHTNTTLDFSVWSLDALNKCSGMETCYLPQPGFYPWSVFRAEGSSGWGRSMWGPCRSGRLLSRPGGTNKGLIFVMRIGSKIMRRVMSRKKIMYRRKGEALSSFTLKLDGLTHWPGRYHHTIWAY